MPVCGTPWKTTSTQLLGGPLMWRPQPMVKDIEGHHVFALGARNPDKTPACRPNAPPSMASPAPAAAPRMQMMCPWSARIGARRSLRSASGVLRDSFKQPERLHRFSRAAVAKIAAPSHPSRSHPPLRSDRIARDLDPVAKPHARATQSQGSAGSGQVFPHARAHSGTGPGPDHGGL